MIRRIVSFFLLLALLAPLLSNGTMISAEALENPAISAEDLEFDLSTQSIGGWNLSGVTVNKITTQMTETRDPVYDIELKHGTNPDAAVTIQIVESTKLLITDDESKTSAAPSGATMKSFISASNKIKKSGYTVNLSNGIGKATLYLVCSSASDATSAGKFLQNTCVFNFTIAGPDTSNDPTPENVNEIKISTPPDNVEYLAGQFFNRAGMIVTAILFDGSEVPVAGYSVSPSEALSEDIQEVTISYAGHEAKQAIIVTPPVKINKIEIENGQILTNQKWVFSGSPTETRTNEYHAVIHYGEEKGKITLSVDAGTTVSVNGVSQTVTSEGKCSLELDTSVEGVSSSVAVKSGVYTGNYTFVCYSQAFDGMPSRVRDYLCMASQYTNAGGLGPYGYNAVSTLRGVHVSSTTTSTELTGPTSLGNWGGYIVYEYDEPIKDDPNNPYGVDFIVYGNSQDGGGGFAEPGQVYVSEDGEMWYPLAGSLHYEKYTHWDSSKTYNREENGTASGTSYSYPQEKYYPLFAWNDETKNGMTLTGVYQAGSDDVNEYGNTLPPYPAFGSADVGPRIPDGSNIAGNPYTGLSLTGSGLSTALISNRPDGFDLKWAVDRNGLPVTFENGIRFVKIQTATFINNSSIGEKSTEVHMMRKAAAAANPVGKTTKPTGIFVNETALDIESGNDVFDARVHGAFEVRVDVPDNVNVYINSERTKAYTFSDISAHKIIRIIVQEETKEPLIYYVKIAEDESLERKPCSIISFDVTSQGKFTDRGGKTLTRAYNNDSTDRGFPEVLPREGYTFLGWKNSLGEIFQEYSPNMPESLKLTAAWRANSPSEPGDNITVSFRLIGSTKSEREINLLTGNYWGAKYVTWIGTQNVTVSGDATVLDVLIKALEEAELSYENPSGSYVTSITSPDGVKLEAMTNGPRSGWMFTIGDEHPLNSVAEQKLVDGAKIVFHYVNDYSYEVADWDKLGGVEYPAAPDSVYHNAWLKAEDTGKDPGPNDPAAPDKTNLKLAINDAKQLNESDYTPETWAVLRNALTLAWETDTDASSTKAQINAACDTLKKAMDMLQRAKLGSYRQALKDTLAYIAQTVPAPAFGTTSGEWSVLALARGGYDPGAGYFDEYYDRIVETVKASPNAPKLHAQKSTDNSRLILALSAIGRDPRNVGNVNLLAAFTDMDWVEYQGVNGPIFALIALDAGNYPEPGENTRQALVDRIVSRQLSSGGFPINPGGDVDLDMTGMALQALAPYKAQANVSQAIDRALAYLSSVQNQNGGFGNNSEVNVQAIVALSALGIDAKTDARFVKSGGDPVTALLNYAVDGGGFKHLMSQTSANAMATDQAAYALVAYTRFLDGKNRLYDMTDVEPAVAGTVEVTVEPEVTDTAATARPSLDTALETAKTEEKDIIQVTVTAKQKDKVAVILNSITANAIADVKKTLNVTTENGGLSIAHDALKSIAEQAGKIASADEIVLNVERKKNEDETVKQTVTAALDKLTSNLTETKDQIATKASIIEVTIKVNDQPITSFGGHSLTVDLPVSSDLYAAGKSYKTLVISDGGKTEEITGRCRDRNGKRVVTVRTTHLSTFVVVPVLAAAEPVKPDQPDRPTGNGEIEVRFTLLGDSIHGETDTPHTLRGGNLDTWVSQTTYTLKEGATVWDLLKKVFSENGMTCSNPSGNYVESITWKGKTLGEFTNGKNSGWMYTLNGTHPSLGVSEQVLKDGDRVVWHYTDDYTKEEGSEKWGGGAGAEKETGVMQPKVTADKNGAALAKLDADSVKEMIANAKENNWNVLAIQPDVEGTATKIGIILTKETAGMITDKSALGVDLRTRYGNIVVTNAGLKALAGTVKETLELSVEKTERGTVMATVAVDGRTIDNVTGGVLVSLPLEGDGNVVAIIRDGKEEIIRKSVVDGKRMLLLADGSCELKIVDNRKSFNDTPNHWAKDAVDFVSSHELFNGTGANVFAPDTPMSRAMLATVLFRLEDAAADGSNPFSDVAAGTWYTDAVIWASGNKIVNGTGNGFAPDRDVTRQELVAMLYRYANSIGMDTGNTGSLDKFADRNGVADWAQEAMGWAVANGLVNGRTATTLAPEGTATRGEVAAITQRLVTLMVK